MTDLSDQRVLITAGAAGIGRSMAEAFDRAGARVWVTDVDAAAIASCPDTWRASVVDASDEGAMRNLFQDVGDRWGGLDTVCANAGISGPTAGVQDISLEDWRRCVSVNLEGAFLASKYAVPYMRAQKGGSILITSSTAGLGALPRRAPYVSAKWAVLGLMKTLAMELGPFGARANAICPGSVDGPRMDGVIRREAEARGIADGEVRQSYTACVAMRSFIQPQDVAEMAVFLASPQARFVSGQVIAVDGYTVNMDS
ncbi:SDR family oxidoreductase [Defluviimonas sp. SAOS-178_SWC]|uniref:SDR family oxidoreductase n=1 Tax=Defluviimonas sp. SAOS-178_SWC TaxID=3121287 RepID=UPI0032219043